MKPMYSKEGVPGGEPLDASTVILVRERPGSRFEIFMMRRHIKQSFMGGAFVFPGGRLDEDDCDPGLAAHIKGLSAKEAALKLNEPDLSGEMALGLFMAAVRETFEEAGVLLAGTASGENIDLTDGETASRFASYRLELHEHKLSLKELAKKENLLYDLDLLVPYSHWITPKVESKRFDTRFLLARMPRGQLPIHDSMEMTKSVWISPKDALGKHEAGEIMLMPPTLKTIEELAGFDSAEALFSASASFDLQVILPQAFPTPEGFGVKLPFDPEYSIAEYKQPLRPGEPSRIVMLDGKWHTMQAEN